MENNQIRSMPAILDAISAGQEISSEELTAYKHSLYDLIISLGHVPVGSRENLYQVILERTANYIKYITAPQTKISFVKFDSDDFLGLYLPNDDTITMNQKLLQVHPREGRDMLCTFDYYRHLMSMFALIEHEYTHSAQRTHRLETGLVDNGIYLRYTRIQKLAELHPEKQEQYRYFSLLMHDTNQVEACANKVGYVKALEFAKDLEKYFNEQHPEAKILKNNRDAAQSYEEHEKYFVNITDEQRCNLKNVVNIEHIVETATYNLNTFNSELTLFQAQKIEQMPAIQQDFADYAALYVEKGGEVDMTEEEFLELCRVKGFENEQVIDTFIAYNRAHLEIPYSKEYLAAWQAEKEHYLKLKATQTATLPDALKPYSQPTLTPQAKPPVEKPISQAPAQEKQNDFYSDLATAVHSSPQEFGNER